MKQIDKNFINYDGEYVNIPMSFRYYQCKFKNYELKEYDGILYFIASHPLKYENGEFKEFDNKNPTYFMHETMCPVVAQDVELLISLLKLNIRLKILEYDIKNKKVQKLITNWCKRYGLPFTGEKSIICEYGTDSLWDKYKKVGFSVLSFMQLLRQLNSNFELHLAAKGEKSSFTKTKLKSADCQGLSAVAFSNLIINFEFDYNTCRMITTFNNLFEAAFYELVQSATISNRTNTSISICECCGNPYERKRKNQKYCSDCSPQKAYKRRISKRNK